MVPIIERLENAEIFFKILPRDWQKLIEPNWREHKNTAEILIVKLGENIAGGGIVFSRMPPNATSLELSFKHLFSKGYKYLGFIFILPEYRNNKLASFWLKSLKDITNNNKFWLTIEEFHLKSFYEKNGFKLVSTNSNENLEEWILISN